MKLIDKQRKNEALTSIDMAISSLRHLDSDIGPFSVVSDEQIKKCREKVQELLSDLYWLTSVTKGLAYFTVGQKVKFDFNGASFTGQVISETEEHVDVRSLPNSPVYWAFKLKKDDVSIAEDPA